MENAMTISTAMSAERNQSITQTIRSMSKRLYAFIRRRVGSTEDAEDILQDVFYQLAGNTEPIEQLTSWLFKVTRNKITDSYRKQKLPLADDVFQGAGDDEEGFDWKEMLIAEGPDPESEFLRNLFWEALHKALDELPEAQRTVFMQTEIDGMAFKEISALTGDPVATLISRKRYAVLHLRERLQDLKNDLLTY
jgi:RNA polymerase sigma factor (sigma-70 family)